MRRIVLLLALAAFLLSSCALRDRPSPQAAAEEWLAKLTAIPFLTPTQPTELPDVELLMDLPLFGPAPSSAVPAAVDPWATKSRGEQTDAQILAQLATQLAKTGQPETAPDFPAVYIGQLEGEVYAYDLGDYAFFLFSRSDGQWRPSRICEDEGREAKIVTHNGVPLLLCTAMAGTYQPVSLAALYRGEQQLFRIAGITPEGIQLGGGEREMPDLVVAKERRLMGLKGGFPVVARYHLVWAEGRYQIESMAWQEDWGYHLARFMQLWQAGRPEEAAAEFAEPPADLTAYIEAQAPALISHRGVLLYQFPERQYPQGRAYFFAGDRVRLESPGLDDRWVWFEFDERGRITTIGEEPGL